MLECDECPRTFIDKSGLISHHRNVHTDDRPYACAVCAKAFAIASRCITHEKTHLKPVNFAVVEK
jgi:KRAB domain-containing zinc finger protein